MSAKKFALKPLTETRATRRGRHFRGTAGGRSFGRWWKRLTNRVARRVGLDPEMVRLDAAAGAETQARAAHRSLASASAQCVGDNVVVTLRWDNTQRQVA